MPYELQRKRGSLEADIEQDISPNHDLLLHSFCLLLSTHMTKKVNRSALFTERRKIVPTPHMPKKRECRGSE